MTVAGSQLIDLLTRQLSAGRTPDEARKAAEAELAFMERSQVTPLPAADRDGLYPELLRGADDAPALLYCLGTPPPHGRPAIAIVGTRHATAYGTAFVEDLVKALASTFSEPVTVVSGLAYGIDAAAHRAALKAGLPTVAVVAHGLKTLYPAAHRRLAADIIAAGGALMTEYTSETPVFRGNFLARNRIVAGMASLLVVAESDHHGGALSTARMAAEYGRPVYALPGRLTDKYSTGTNRLIAQGRARGIWAIDEMLATLPWPRRAAGPEQGNMFAGPALNPEEARVVDFLRASGEADMATLLAAMGRPVAELTSLLFAMEMNGVVRSLPGNRFSL